MRKQLFLLIIASVIWRSNFVKFWHFRRRNEKLTNYMLFGSVRLNVYMLLSSTYPFQNIVVSILLNFNILGAKLSNLQIIYYSKSVMPNVKFSSFYLLSLSG